MRSATVVRGGVTAVVTAAVLISTVDDIVCAAKELTGTSASVADLTTGCGSASTLRPSSAVDLYFDGVDLGGGRFRAGGFRGFVSRLVGVRGRLCLAFGVFRRRRRLLSFDSELVWAPPVLTTTSGGACEVVDPVEVDVVASDPVVCSVAAVAVSLSACVESDALVDDFDCRRRRRRGRRFRG